MNALTAMSVTEQTLLKFGWPCSEIFHIAEKNFNNVLIDSDNLTYAQRNQWIEWFPYFDEHILLP